MLEKSVKMPDNLTPKKKQSLELEEEMMKIMIEEFEVWDRILMKFG